MILSLTRERGGELKPRAVVVQRQRKMPQKISAQQPIDGRRDALSQLAVGPYALRPVSRQNLEGR
jgi:hypothetical protein